MRSRLVVVLAAGGLLALLVNGCGNSSNSTSTSSPSSQASDQAEVAATLSSALTLTDDGLAEDPSRVSASAASPVQEVGGAGRYSVQAAIRPFTWWQNITHVAPTWTFAFADTDSTGHPRLCDVTLTKHMTGTLVIIPVSAADSTKPDSAHPITKPIDKTVTRRIELSRLLINGVRVWKVVAVTGAFVTTPGATTHLESLHIQSSSGVDTTITNPLEWFALRHVLRFAANDTVTVTAATARTNDPLFLPRWDFRRRLRNNLDGTYTITWVTSAWGGWRWFGIQAMTHGSLYDDTAPFDMQAWHLPFRVVGGQPDVDYYP